MPCRPSRCGVPLCMFTDSHCHLTFPELASQIPALRAAMAAAQVTRALCISCTMEEFPDVHALALAHGKGEIIF